MTIRLLPDGALEFDSVEEAREYMSEQIQRNKQEAPYEKFLQKPQKKWPKPDLDDKIKLSERGARLLKIIKEHGKEGIMSADLQDKMGIKETQLAPIFAAMGRKFLKNGIRMKDVYKKENIAGNTVFFIKPNLPKSIEL